MTRTLSPTAVVDQYCDIFDQTTAGRAGEEPAWITAIRKSAIDRFRELGLPTARDEEWRLTNPTPLTKQPFPLTQVGDQATDLPAALSDIRLVFVDGRYAAELSTVPPHSGMTICSLRQAVNDEPPGLEPHLAHYADCKTESFTALNTAMFFDGAFVHVHKGVVLPTPVELLYVSTKASHGCMTFPRNLIVADDDSLVTVVERVYGCTSGVGCQNGVTEVVAGRSSVVEHLWIEEAASEELVVSTLRGRLERDAYLASHSFLLGGRLVRNNVQPVLDGEGCHCLINGLYIGGGKQHLDNHMRVEHAQPNGESRQFYRGVLDDHARGVFAGRIIVRPDAQKTDAKQNNANLLLSGNAEADSKPQLEIYADDVKCTHGATIGQIDEEQLFYLRTRGLEESSARNLLVFAFAAECLERVKHEPTRQYLFDRLLKQLPHSSVLES